MWTKPDAVNVLQVIGVLSVLWITLGVPSTNSLMVFPQPSFVEPIANTTVSAGRDVSLTCIVENLGSYRVAWSHKERSTLISIQERIIMRNSKYAVTHQNYRAWYLHLTKVDEKDSGHYMCQVNTTPMISQTGHITVVVAPNIVDNETSSDTDVREGSDVVLQCTASGSPTPNVKWRKEDGNDMLFGNRKVHEKVGKFLNFTSVSRLSMGAYLCIAFNGILPSISKRIMLNIQFPPMIWIPNQLIGVAIGDEIALDCHVEAFPEPVMYWTKGPQNAVLVSGETHDSVVIRNGVYKLHMRLRLRSIVPEDFTSYACVAKNSLGDTEGKIRLYEVAPTTTDTHIRGSVKPISENLQGLGKSEPGTLSPAYANIWSSEKVKTIWKNPSEKGSIDAGGTHGSSDAGESPVLSFSLCTLLYVIYWLLG